MVSPHNLVFEFEEDLIDAIFREDRYKVGMEESDKAPCHCTCHEAYETFAAGSLCSDGTSYWCSPCWNGYPCENG